jgi:hypothetical protein
MQLKTKKLAVITTVVILALAVLGVYRWGDDIRLGLTYGWDNLPTHEPLKGCSWVKKTFQKSGITFFLQDCGSSNSLMWSYSEDSEGRVLRTNDLHSLLTMQVFTKRSPQSPLAIMEDWFSKLTPEEQKKCEIQSVDTPIEYLPNGSRSDFETPHPTPHKIRYKIDMKPEVIKDIDNKSDGVPSGTQYDFLCGPDVGAHFTSSPPYFEFDDRSPSKYLFVGSLGNDDSVLVDLNSIGF